MFAFGQAQGEFLDEGGDVGVGLDRAFPLFHAEDFFGHANLHVLLDRRLARQAPAFARFAPGEVRLFGGQHFAAAFFDDAFALRAGAAAAAGRGQEDVLRRQRLQQLATGRDGDAAFAIDFNGDIAAGDEFGARKENEHDQRQHDAGEHAYAEQDFGGHICTPEKDMKPSAISPMVMKVMPRPRRPAGVSLYLSFSRMPASAAMASAHDRPEPTP